MDGQIGGPAATADHKIDEDGGGSSRWRSFVRRAASAFSMSREANATERLTEFLSQEAKDGDGRSQQERALLLNVARLHNLRVDDVMTPRANIIALEARATLEETLAAFRDSGHSRLPVHRETLDDPIGVVHLKDLALSHGFGEGGEAFQLGNLLRDVETVPPSMRAQALLQRMQGSRKHMALVIDEYGGVDGLVTIENLIEEIVGDIEDEHDGDGGPLWRRQPDGAYLAEARATIEDFMNETGHDLRTEDWDDDVDTLGGLVFTLCGRVPERGEVIAHPGGFEFDIIDADPRRVKRLRIRVGATSSAARPGPAPVAEGSAYPETKAEPDAELEADDSTNAESAPERPALALVTQAS